MQCSQVRGSAPVQIGSTSNASAAAQTKWSTTESLFAVSEKQHAYQARDEESKETELGYLAVSSKGQLMDNNSQVIAELW